jgi:hypothetical protein
MQERARLGALSKDERAIRRSRELIAQASVAPAPTPTVEYSVTPKRADELRQYWRRVKAISDSSLSPADKRAALDVGYRITFSKVLP